MEGEAAMTAFAIDWVEATFGSKLKVRLSGSTVAIGRVEIAPTPPITKKS